MDWTSDWNYRPQLNHRLVTSLPQAELKGSAGLAERQSLELVENLRSGVQYLVEVVIQGWAEPVGTDLLGPETEDLAVVEVMSWVARFGENLLEAGK